MKIKINKTNRNNIILENEKVKISVYKYGDVEKEELVGVIPLVKRKSGIYIIDISDVHYDIYNESDIIDIIIKDNIINSINVNNIKANITNHIAGDAIKVGNKKEKALSYTIIDMLFAIGYEISNPMENFLNHLSMKKTNDVENKNKVFKNDKHNAFIEFKDKLFILPKGTQLSLYKGKEKNAFHNAEKHEEILIGLKEKSYLSDDLILLKDKEFGNPSIAARLISGRQENGWTFFEGLDSVRNIITNSSY